MKRPLYRLVDALLSTTYVRERLWQTARDLFAQPPPSSAARLALAPLPPRYQRETPPSTPPLTQAQRPIFISARFRSGSTFLWQLFRSIPRVTSYYEPLNEARWFIANDAGHRVDSTHIGVEDYRREYAGMADLAQWYSEDFAFRYLYMDERSHNPALQRYISELIHRAPGRAVLQFNRVDLRLAWLKAHFPEALIVHLYRDPREQWMSIVAKSGKIPPDYRITGHDAAGLDSFYTLDWALDLRHVFPFLEPAGRHPYALHYLLWRLSYSFGQRYADYAVCYEELIGNFMPTVTAMFDFLAVEHADVAALARLNHGAEKTRWPEYASAEWFDTIERDCEQRLATHFPA